eukprot:CAMPEP_0178427140 /NCGR_PEP_ID=MMETSP0689_2-20121128/29590_1 /TAXON_ID=160604 /ORGANISM="Amphidinium massartii, Strain CS-259" /LENGTH=75 /DNA_ID=CAMNT_0020048835 /DNA_START=158 /DNA_END=385 /DNA_ORIENTATION=+
MQPRGGGILIDGHAKGLQSGRNAALYISELEKLEGAYGQPSVGLLFGTCPDFGLVSASSKHHKERHQMLGCPSCV